MTIFAFFLGVAAGICLSIIIAGVMLGGWFDEKYGREE